MGRWITNGRQVARSRGRIPIQTRTSLDALFVHLYLRNAPSLSRLRVTRPPARLFSPGPREIGDQASQGACKIAWGLRPRAYTQELDKKRVDGVASRYVASPVVPCGPVCLRALFSAAPAHCGSCTKAEPWSSTGDRTSSGGCTSCHLRLLIKYQYRM